jgi:dTDP-glucose 4,6-dehydratase
MIDSAEPGPVNLGNPAEFTVAELAELILSITGSESVVEYHPLPADDPTRRRPDIARATGVLGWRPRIELEEGIRRTVAWFAERPAELSLAAPALAGGQLDEPQLDGTAVR